MFLSISYKIMHSYFACVLQKEHGFRNKSFFYCATDAVFFFLTTWLEESSGEADSGKEVLLNGLLGFSDT